jgi:hypothetical protein
MVAALDRLQAVRDSPDAVGQWAQAEVDWMGQNARAAAIHAGPPPFRAYWEGITQLLEDGIFETSTSKDIDAMVALRDALAGYAIGQEPRY